MSYDHNLCNPAGRVYSNSRNRETWTVELEIGGSLWLRSGHGKVITMRACRLARHEWERIA